MERIKIKKSIGIFFLGVLAGVVIIWLFSPAQYPTNAADDRVAQVLAMYPDAELVYAIRSSRSGYSEAKIFVYWVDASFEDVMRHKFIPNSRNHSQAGIPHTSEIGAGYYEQVYYLTDLPQDELDKILDFEHELCCYGDDPERLTLLSLYIFSADANNSDDLETLYFGYGDGMINPGDLRKRESRGTYIVYGYRVRSGSSVWPSG